MHHILERQIKRIFGEQMTIPSEWRTFLQLISETYSHFDEDRALLNRSLELNSKEFFENNQRLKKAKEEVERKIKESTENLKKYQTLVNNLSVGVYRNTPGPQGHFLEANPAIVALFEADSKKEFLQHNVSDLYQNPADRNLFVQKITKYGFVKNEELNLVSLKGKKIICSVSAVMKKDKDGSIYFDGLIEDITNRKMTEEELKNARDELEIRVEERTQTLQQTNANLNVEIAQRKQVEDKLKKINDELEDSKKAIVNVLEDLRFEKNSSEKARVKDEAILASIADGCVVVNDRGEIVLINQTAQEMLGFTSEESIGKQWGEILQREDKNGNPISPEKGAIRAALSTILKADGEKQSLANGQTKIKTTHEIYYYVRKNKTKFPVSITAAPVILENEIVGAIEVFRDVTKEQEIDKAKTEFVSIASHALRTPLTAIDGLVSMILDGEYGQVNENLKQPLEDVNTSSQRLIHLVNDLLNLSWMQAGKFKYTLSDFSIADVITETVHLLQPLVEQKRLQLVATKLVPVNVQGDSDKVKEVLNNLIGNSLNFTNKGSITVTTTAVDGKVEVHITDTGIGIAKEDQQKLFGQFQQLQSGRGRPVGTGLGLHISKEIVSKMGGNLWIEKSEVGKGSTFAFSLPKSKSELAQKVKQEIEAETRADSGQIPDTIIHTKQIGASR